jgi:hypothetical protein
MANDLVDDGESNARFFEDTAYVDILSKSVLYLYFG